MSRRTGDIDLRDFSAACVMGAFIGALAGGLVASLIMAGVIMLGGA